MERANSDLWSRYRINADFHVLSQFYKHLAELEKFPAEYLVPVGKTILDLSAELE